jgi:hypothetical protein
MVDANRNIVIPAQAGIHCAERFQAEGWIPAYAGMTIFGWCDR